MYNTTSTSSSSTNSTTTQPPPPPPSSFMSPRISFSNDFVVDSHHHSLINSTTSSSSSNSSKQVPCSDFEFSSSVSELNMMSDADELFFKGKILPFRGSLIHNTNPRTLRDELLDNNDDDDNNNNNNNDFSLKPPKSSSSSSSSSHRWKSFLNLRKSHIGSKKPYFSFTSHTAKSSQDGVLKNEDTSSSDMELGV